MTLEKGKINICKKRAKNKKSKNQNQLLNSRITLLKLRALLQ